MEKKRFKNSPFHRALKKALQGEKWHRRQGLLAKEAGISESYMSGLRSGEKSPSMDKVDKIASALGLSVNEFMALGDECSTSMPGPPPQIIDLPYEMLVSQFQDKEMAYRINEALLEIERLNPRTFEDLAGLIFKTCEDITRLSKYRIDHEPLKLVKKK